MEYRQILLDFAEVGDSDDPDDLRVSVAEALRENLAAADRKHFDVVAFTHLDRDHCAGAADFFWLEHDKNTHTDDRVRIDELWVPAAALTESDLEDEADTLQREARFRFRAESGVRVFSRPERLREWCEEEGIDLSSREEFLSDAGTFVPGFASADDGLQLFVHCPFAKRQDENNAEDRNANSLVLHGTFWIDGTPTKVFFGSDITHEVIGEIVSITREHDNETSLEWDVMRVPHHCSYLAIGPDKGRDRTEPTDECADLYDDCRLQNGFFVASSKPIPSAGSDEDEAADPPHRQAASYYKQVAGRGRFVVTMEHPRASRPRPLIIEIDRLGAAVKREAGPVGAAILTERAPRAGER